MRSDSKSGTALPRGVQNTVADDAIIIQVRAQHVRFRGCWASALVRVRAEVLPPVTDSATLYQEPRHLMGRG